MINGEQRNCHLLTIIRKLLNMQAHNFILDGCCQSIIGGAEFHHYDHMRHFTKKDANKHRTRTLTTSFFVDTFFNLTSMSSTSVVLLSGNLMSSGSSDTMDTWFSCNFRIIEWSMAEWTFWVCFTSSNPVRSFSRTCDVVECRDDAGKWKENKYIFTYWSTRSKHSRLYYSLKR